MVKCSVLFSREPNRNATIAKCIDGDRFNVEFADITSRLDLRRFDLVVPLLIQDIKLLSKCYSEWNGIKFLAPTLSAVDLTHNKPRFNDFVRSRFGPEFLPPTTGPGEFPSVLKRNQDAGAEHAHLLRTVDDEKQFSGLCDDPAYFRQAYVAGDREYTTHILFDETVRYSCTVEFKMNREFYLRGVGMHPFENVQIALVPSRHNHLFDSILKKIPFRGLCCFNYKLIEDRPIIFELNPRFGGSLPRDVNQMLETLRKTLST